MTPQEDDRKKHLRAGFKLGFGMTSKITNFEAYQHLSDEEMARQLDVVFEKVYAAYVAYVEKEGEK